MKLTILYESPDGGSKLADAIVRGCAAHYKLTELGSGHDGWFRDFQFSGNPINILRCARSILRHSGTYAKVHLWGACLNVPRF